MKANCKSKWQINTFLHNKPSSPLPQPNKIQSKAKAIPLSHINLNEKNRSLHPSPKKQVDIVRPKTVMGEQSNDENSNRSSAYYEKIIIEKNKLILQLKAENTRLSFENNALINEKNNSSNSIEQFTKSMGKVFESMITNPTTMVAGRANAGTPSRYNIKPENIEYLKNLKRTIATILQESTTTKQTVQNAVNELQSLIGNK